MSGYPLQKRLRAQRLGRLMQQARQPVKAGRSYTRFVKTMRLILPMAALLVMAVVMAWPKMEQSITPLTPESVSQTPQTVTQNELINPRFEGADLQNNPYVLIAQRATQSAQNPDILLLESPSGDITLGAEEKLAITAQKGTYRQNASKLLLEGQVRLMHSNGYIMDTNRLSIDIKAQESRTDQPVTISGPAAALKATGMDARNSEGLIIFTGPATLILKERLEGL
ncbi:MAG: LPS export ABC transporter periplasmic protein LptC [Micavibrio aeruginosavorus]|uniref:LPS export ABC transporter periplasmic protein LptC n=1 Tax=Micavibrio aeruginosavorus TaxID=349221 RepID=A0A7T5UGF9_9BACT|nr:MAG: LPS export ABC transporter periplasmic protein LptC [Micavibrio aeruginosavorus]